MPFRITVQPSEREFEAERQESVLEAGLSAGVAFNYGCSGGSCGRCRARLVAGELQKLRPHDFVFTEAEKGQGYFLMCSNAARSDLVIESGAARLPDEIQFQEIEARVKALQPLTDKVMLLQLQTPRSNRLRFLAGQSVALSVGDDAGTYAIASCPCDDRNLQFHVRSQANDIFAQHVFSDMRVGSSVNVYGPVGDFVLDQASTRSVLLLACNSGFAPIKSLAEHVMQLERVDALHLYWLATFGGGQYMANQCRAWADAVDIFHYRELHAASLQSASLEGSLRQIPDDLGTLAAFDAYIAGPEMFTTRAAAMLTANGVPPAHVRQTII